MTDFKEVAYALDDIAIHGSKLEKEALLKHYANVVPGFTDVLKFIYDPYFKTGLKQAKLMRAYGTQILSVEEIMAYLQDGTGTDTEAAVANGFIYSFDDEVCRWAATGLVTKDLQIGVSLTTLNKVFGKDFIPKIGIMRGMLCPDTIHGIYIASTKLDGNRRLIMTKETGIEIYTRSGRRDLGWYQIEEEAMQLPTGYVFDCELTAEGEFKEAIELRQATASIANSKGRRCGAIANCFDILTIAEYVEGISKRSAVGRKAILAGIFGDYKSYMKLFAYFSEYDEKHSSNVANSLNALFHGHKRIDTPHIKPVETLGIVENYAAAIELAKPIWEAGGEGIMLVEAKSAYEVNPNPRPTLLKIKLTKDFVCRCIGVVEGDNKYIGMLGAITVEYIRKDYQTKHQVKVGTGFTDAERNMYWKDPHKIVGKYVEIESFGESNNKDGGYSLNCPRFKRIRGIHE